MRKKLYKLLKWSKLGHKCVVSERNKYSVFRTWLCLEIYANRPFCLAGVSWDSHSQRRSLAKLGTVSNQIGHLKNMIVQCLYCDDYIQVGPAEQGEEGTASKEVYNGCMAYQQLGKEWNPAPCQLNPSMFRLGCTGSTIVPFKSPGVFRIFTQGSWSFQNSSWRPGRIPWSPKMTMHANV